jgi:hypothetical protein
MWNYRQNYKLFSRGGQANFVCPQIAKSANFWAHSTIANLQLLRERAGTQVLGPQITKRLSPQVVNPQSATFAEGQQNKQII